MDAHTGALSNQAIDELFKNEYFKMKLNEYIVNNLKIRQDYDAYEGKYDEMSFSFAGEEIDVESKTYGY